MGSNTELERDVLLQKIEQTRRLLAAALDKMTLDRLTERLRELEDELRRKWPAPEQELGGGDICSLEREPSTEDDQPLD